MKIVKSKNTRGITKSEKTGGGLPMFMVFK